jgi:type III secretion protein R
MENSVDIVGPLFTLFLIPFYLMAAITLTSFVKVTVVLLILRNAIGLQQVPSTIIVMALALFLSAFVSMPVFEASLFALTTVDLNVQTVDQFLPAMALIAGPFQEFILANVDPEQLEFFTDMAEQVWEGSSMEVSQNNFFVQVPAFLISELSRGFQIGLLLYLPFTAIDLAITTILMALGMQQVQPSMIAAPFKLVLFIFIDGWDKLIEGLLLSYNYV